MPHVPSEVVQSQALHQGSKVKPSWALIIAKMTKAVSSAETTINRHELGDMVVLVRSGVNGDHSQ